MATIQINMHEAKTRLSQLGEKAWQGEKIVIAKAGKPYLDLIPHKEPAIERKPGRLKGKIKIKAGFDSMDEKIPKDFEQSK